MLDVGAGVVEGEELAVETVATDPARTRICRKSMMHVEPRDDVESLKYLLWHIRTAIVKVAD